MAGEVVAQKIGKSLDAPHVATAPDAPAAAKATHTWGTQLVDRINRELVTTIHQVRLILNTIILEWNSGSFQMGKGGPLMQWGHGAPAPLGVTDRGFYIDMDGGIGFTFYLWEGAAWRPL